MKHIRGLDDDIARRNAPLACQYAFGYRLRGSCRHFVAICCVSVGCWPDLRPAIADFEPSSALLELRNVATTHVQRLEISWVLLAFPSSTARLSLISLAVSMSLLQRVRCSVAPRLPLLVAVRHAGQNVRLGWVVLCCLLAERSDKTLDAL